MTEPIDLTSTGDENEPGKVHRARHIVHLATLDIVSAFMGSDGANAVARQLDEIKARLIELQGDVR